MCSFLVVRRGVELTDAGRTLLDHARAILAHLDHASETTRRMARGEQGRICVGVAPTAPFHPFVPRVIRAFREAFPMVSVMLEECLSNQAIECIRKEQLDLAFLRANVADPQDLVINPLLDEPMVVALPSVHALAQSDYGDTALWLKAFASETFIVFGRREGPGLYDVTMAACRRAGFSSQLGQEAPRITSTLGLVAAGLGISLAQPRCSGYTWTA